MPDPKTKTTKAKPKSTSIYAGAQPGDIVIVRLSKGKTTPKPPTGVSVWTLDGDSLRLSPADMFSRGWVRRKG